MLRPGLCPLPFLLQEWVSCLWFRHLDFENYPHAKWTVTLKPSLKVLGEAALSFLHGAEPLFVGEGHPVIL